MSESENRVPLAIVSAENLPLKVIDLSELGSATPQKMTVQINGTDLADFDLVRVSPEPEISGNDRAPFDLDFHFKQFGKVPEDTWVEITVTIAEKIPLRFQGKEHSISAGNQFSQGNMRRKKNAVSKEAVVYVKNAKTNAQQDPFLFNLGVVFGNGRWKLPVLIDPKIHNTGGGGGSGGGLDDG